MTKHELIEQAKASGKRYVASGYLEDGEGTCISVHTHDDNSAWDDITNDINKRHGHLLFTDDEDEAKDFACGFESIEEYRDGRV